MRLWGLHVAAPFSSSSMVTWPTVEPCMSMDSCTLTGPKSGWGRPCPTDGSAVVHTATTGHLLTVGQDTYHGCCTCHPKHLSSYLRRKAPPWSGRLSRWPAGTCNGPDRGCHKWPRREFLTTGQASPVRKEKGRIEQEHIFDKSKGQPQMTQDQ